MTREEAIKLIDTHTVCFYNEIDSPTLQALHMAIEALSADAKTKCIAQINVDTEEVCRRIKEEYDKVLNDYMKWLEEIIVEAETFEWLCEDATDEEWCEENCNYASIQAECLRHIYEISKGGEE